MKLTCTYCGNNGKEDKRYPLRVLANRDIGGGLHRVMLKCGWCNELSAMIVDKEGNKK